MYFESLDIGDSGLFKFGSQQARVQDFQRRGSYMGKSEPKPKGGVLFGTWTFLL